MGALACAVSACDRTAPPAPSAPAPATKTDDVARSGGSEAAPAEAAPPATAWRSFRATDDGFTVRWTTIPDPIVARDPFVVLVELYRDAECTTPLRGGSVDVDASMPQHGHGMNVRPKMIDLGDGRHRAEGMLFHMPGRWELFVDRTESGVTERAQTTVMIPISP
ncbi:MAG: FixH family protein [Phycisphaerales bacterium]